MGQPNRWTTLVTRPGESLFRRRQGGQLVVVRRADPAHLASAAAAAAADQSRTQAAEAAGARVDSQEARERRPAGARGARLRRLEERLGRDGARRFAVYVHDAVARAHQHLRDTTTPHVSTRYDTRCYFNVRSKADTSQLNLPHGTDN